MSESSSAAGVSIPGRSELVQMRSSVSEQLGAVIQMLSEWQERAETTPPCVSLWDDDECETEETVESAFYDALEMYGRLDDMLLLANDDPSASSESESELTTSPS